MSRKQRIYRFVKQLYSRFREDDVPGIGAQLTYYLILSFFPFLIFMVSVLGFVQLSGDSLVAELIRILPADTGESVSGIWSEVAGRSSGAFLSLGMIATLWSASNGLNAIGNYSKTYGSLGGIIVLLIWLYLSSILILLGGEINATLAAGKLKETPAANIKRRPMKTRQTIRGEF